MCESLRSFWVLEYVNGRRFIGRYFDHWTWGREIDTAVMFATEDDAEHARLALLAEAKDRISEKDSHAQQMWWDLYGGLVVVTEVERIVRRRKKETTSND
jgi:hypothetical protein